MTMWPTHWKVRPYMITADRTAVRPPLLVHSLVSVGRYDPLFAASLPPETRALYEQARTVCTVAELSAHCHMPLGVTRVLLADLAASDRLIIHSAPPTSTDHRLDLLERVCAGLRKLA
jgi:uncharacterized protein DUF742